MPLWVPAKDMQADSKLKQYVYIIAKSAECKVEKMVLVSFQSGYIFIQADKTIYTPGSTVLYRLFTMGGRLQLVNRTVIVEFETPEGIMVKRDLIDPTGPNSGGGILSQSHKLPEIINLGTWTIIARFEDSPLQNYTRQFDVKEYVLPNFEVSMKPRIPFFYINGDEVHVDITARYLHGRPVEGNAFILFGVKFDDEKKTIPTSLQNIEIYEGSGEAKLTRKMLTESFTDIYELIDCSIYVSVAVLTTAGSDMVNAEFNDIHIVTSPYKILFTKTPKYFKPGMPFELMVFITNPDGTPAHRVPVVATPGNIEGSTQEDGTTTLTINTVANMNELFITVATIHHLHQDNHQAKATMKAIAYKGQGHSTNYLHIGAKANALKVEDNLYVNFNVKSSDPTTENQIKSFTYIIMSKGRIFKVGKQERQPGQSLVSMTLPIVPDYIPSFRIIAYYYVQGEIVADSVWVDVKDTCMGTLEVSGATASDNRVKEPGKTMRLKVTGDHNARVGLVAVDKGVFVLNKKHKLSQSKVWDSVEKNDIGCTPGGGANNVGVFYDAGLALETSFKTSTPQRSEPTCAQPERHQHRSVQLIDAKADKAAKYKGTERKCCEDGMKENIMGHSCGKRVKFIRETSECVKAFMDCCEFSTKMRTEETYCGNLARSNFEEGYLTDEAITSRTEFPESWFWKVEQLVEAPGVNGLSSKTLQMFLKDSITTWEVLAVSLSDGKGICVADPYEITVFKKYFIDLRLPYSVVRNEQVEIRAVLYNYEEDHDQIRVRVELLYNEKFCSASTSKKRFRQEVTMTGKTPRAVSFIIVPLEAGLIDIEVKAFFPNYIGDGVKKKLKVVPEGMKITKTVKVVTLDPANKGKDGVQEEKIEAVVLNDIIPNSEYETMVSIQGTPITQLIEKSIDGSNLGHLIVVPRGCGEQNMISMTPVVIATHFLDNTRQWETLGVGRRAEAIKNINQGYTQQLTYRQDDSSYSIWKHVPGSTWLTAYVVKIFALADNLISIQRDVICGSVEWLVLNKQKPGGVFKEDQAVSSRAMMGGASGNEPEASLTAFVLVALAESREICGAKVNSLEGSIQKASDYLLKKYATLTKPYAVAITAYALAMVNKLPDDRKLMEMSTGGAYWNVPENKQFAIEASSYALLALVRIKKFEKTSGIMQWLNEQRFYGAAWGSTQEDTMGKTDTRQPKLAFENKRTPKPTWQDADTLGAAGGDATIEGQGEDLRSLMLEMCLSLRNIDAKLDTLTSQLDSVKSQVSTHETRLDCLENRHTEFQEFQQVTKEQLLHMDKLLTVIRAKNDDLEARSRRNNLRVTGIPETTAITKMEVFVTDLLHEIFDPHLSLLETPPHALPDEAFKEEIRTDIIDYFALNSGSEPAVATLWDAFKVVIWGKCIARQEGVLKAMRGTITRIEGQIRVLERNFCSATNPVVAAELKDKLLEFAEEAQRELTFLGKYAEARRYGEGDRPGPALAGMIRKSTSTTFIHTIRTPGGDTITGQAEVLNEFRDFYSTLYTATQSTPPENLQEFLDSFALAWFNDTNRRYMDLPITTNDVKQVIKSLLLNKAPGPDGLTTAFYKAYVEEPAPRLLAVYEEALETGSLPASMREALIMTLLKPDKVETELYSIRCDTFAICVLRILMAARARGKQLKQELGKEVKLPTPISSPATKRGERKSRRKKQQQEALKQKVMELNDQNIKNKYNVLRKHMEEDNDINEDNGLEEGVEDEEAESLTLSELSAELSLHAAGDRGDKGEEKERDKENRGTAPLNIIWDAFKATIRGIITSKEIPKTKAKREEKIKLQTELSQASQDHYRAGSQISSHNLLEAKRKMKEFYYDLGETNSNFQAQKIYEESEYTGKLLAWQSKEKQARNRIDQLTDSITKNQAKTTTAIGELFLKHYEGIYQASAGTSLESITDFLQPLEIPKMDAEGKIYLTQDFTALELDEVIESFPNGKANGEDGLPIEFFKTFKGILRKEFLEVINSLLHGGPPPDSFHTAVVLKALLKLLGARHLVCCTATLSAAHKHLFHSSSRAERELKGLKVPDVTLAFHITFIRYLGEADSTMTIVDISMLSGFSPDIDDLRKLSEPVDRYISKFEIEKGMSDKRNVIIYLDKVSHKENDCFSFKAHQFFKVGLIQPAAVTVYEFYSLENRCTTFYHPDKESGLLSKICQRDVCRCAEENCFMQKFVGAITVGKRIEEACAPGVDYVYKAKLMRTEKSDSYDNYMMTITTVIKAGSDKAAEGKIRRFTSHKKCRSSLKLEDGKSYLIWGPNADLWTQKDE
ncbi:A.superbus venom factor 1-like [Lissotriton helveticus]